MIYSLQLRSQALKKVKRPFSFVDFCFPNIKLIFLSKVDIFIIARSLVHEHNKTPNLLGIDHFAVVCFVAWPLNESEAGVDLFLIETSLLLLCKFLLISMRTASLA